MSPPPRAVAPVPIDAPLPRVRTIDVADLNWALAEGWRDFRAKRGDLIFAGLLYPALCVVAVVVTANGPLLQLLFPLVAGGAMLGPALASGFYELARRRELGLATSWRHFLDPLQGRRRLPLIVLTVVFAGWFIAWLFVADLIYVIIFQQIEPLHAATALRQVFTTEAGWTLIAIGNAVGLLFAGTALALGVVSFPMVVDRPVDALTALRTSWKASRRNPGVMIGWGLRIAGLLIVGLVPLAIGLAVVLPWLGYATWHLYTRLVVRESVSVAPAGGRSSR